MENKEVNVNEPAIHVIVLNAIQQYKFGWSLERIRTEIWHSCHRDYAGELSLESIIYRAMDLYGEFLKHIR